MRPTMLWRVAWLVLAVLIVAGSVSCGPAGPNDPFALFRRILLEGGRGRGTLNPGGSSLLFGPMPTPAGDPGQATSLQLRLTCLSGPGVILARWHFDDPQNGLLTAREAFGFEQDAVDLNIGAQALQTTMGYFRDDAVARLYLEVQLANGQPATEVELLAQATGMPLVTVFDLEPNNAPEQANNVERQAGGTLAPSPGVMCPIFGDVVDYYRILPPDVGDGIEVETVEPQTARTVVEVVDEQAVVIGGLTDTNVNVTPLLGNVPLLGRLFRTRPEQDQRESLLILITPHIVNPE